MSIDMCGGSFDVSVINQRTLRSVGEYNICPYFVLGSSSRSCSVQHYWVME